MLDRQKGILDAAAFGDIPVHIVGVGGIGSWAAQLACDMRIRNVHAWDGNIVKAHNPQNQLYTTTCVGMRKVDALRELIEQKNRAYITAHPEFVTQTTRLSGIVFLCVDSMEKRRDIWEDCIRGNPDIALMIDSRMDASFWTILTVDPNDQTHQAMWEHYWFPSSEAQNETTACGSPLAAEPTVCGVAYEAMWQLIRYAARGQGRDVPLHNYKWYDYWKSAWYQESW